MMSAFPRPFACLLLALSCGSPGIDTATAAEITIYRCTGADGQVVIGNVPCPDAADQQVRNMVRPVDGTPPPRRADAPPPPAPQPVVQYVQVATPQPLFECVRDDGSTYESDTGIGEERWVPAWSGGGWPPGCPTAANRGASTGISGRITIWCVFPAAGSRIL